MPDYFYHIGIELFDSDSSPAHLSRTFHALNPFTSKLSRASRNPKYDTMRKAASFSEPHLPNEIIPASCDDSRIDNVYVEGQDDITAGIGTKDASAQTRAAFTITDGSDAAERGIVHLYRDAEETPGLYGRRAQFPSTDLWSGSAPARPKTQPTGPTHSPKSDECTMLAILAVPSYMTPRDFLAFVGQDTRNAVSHFRMVRTSKLNRYMVLMKFKDGRFARQWQSDWNTKLFNNMEPETCQVVFVKSVEVLHNQELRHSKKSSTSSGCLNGSLTAFGSVAHSNKPLAPPTPSLIELPTCPVCLERMDDSTGLITNLCQHVFHCTCLEKWSGYGCPVCRFKDDSFATGVTRSTKSKKYHSANGEYELHDEELECEVCHITDSLWQCLICGVVGCGRYAGKHAYRHFEATGHTFALDLEEQRVWDYDHDCYVHRIIANGSSTSNEKLVELPGRRREGQITALEDSDQDLDVIKRENLAFEYTQLLTSQLESQRMYFEAQIAKAVTNKTKAVEKADSDARAAAIAKQQLNETSTSQNKLQEMVKKLEKSNERDQDKIRKLDESNKKLQKDYEEARTFSDSISQKLKAKETEETALRNNTFTKQVEKIKNLEEEVSTKNFYLDSLQEQIADLRMQIAAANQLKKLVASGDLTQEELEGSTLFAGPPTYKNQTSLISSQSFPYQASKKAVETLASPAKDVTDEQVQESIERTSASFTSLSAMVLSKVGCEFKYKAGVGDLQVAATLKQGGGLREQRGTSGKMDYWFAEADQLRRLLVEAHLLELRPLEDIRAGTGKLSAFVLRQLRSIGSDCSFRAGVTEAEFYKALIEAGMLPIGEDSSHFTAHGLVKTRKMLVEANLLEDHHAARLLIALNAKDGQLEVAPGKTEEDIRNALLKDGILQPKEEQDLYSSDTMAADPEASTSKAKKKRKKNNKKRK